MTSRRLLLLALAALALCPFVFAINVAGARASTVVPSIELDTTIDPGSASWIQQALADARRAHAPLAIIRLNTPGGLDSSMRSIIRAMVNAPFPVVVFVSPNGARAASAGAFITSGADVAAMAPQTNIGSATPISIGIGSDSAVEKRKVTNDAAAYIRALQMAHGRNPNLAEQMVLTASNVTATDALKAHVIDVVANDGPELLRKLDGFMVRGDKARTLRTNGLTIVHKNMTVQYEILEFLVDPTIAFLLIVAGIIGIAIEFLTPGTFVPGISGAIAFVLGIYGSSQLPVNALGVLLLVIAVILFVLELKVGGHGLLGMSAVGALVISGLVMFNTGSSAVSISVPAVIVLGTILGCLALFAALKVIQARRATPRSGAEGLIGAHGQVRTDLDPIGQIWLNGALWRARTATFTSKVPKGARVTVEAVDGLTLIVKPTAPAEETSGEGDTSSAL